MRRFNLGEFDVEIPDGKRSDWTTRDKVVVTHTASGATREIVATEATRDSVTHAVVDVMLDAGDEDKR